MAYREFKLRVPIWDISNDYGDSSAVGSLFTILATTPPEISLAAIYDSFYDYSSARYVYDLYGRIGRGDVVIFISDIDDRSFIAIDMFDEATDQMNTVEIVVCAPHDRADDIANTMKSIRASAEVASALLTGNLGLQEELAIEKFPRTVSNHDTEVLQHAQVFRGGSLIHSTRSA